MTAEPAHLRLVEDPELLRLRAEAARLKRMLDAMQVDLENAEVALRAERRKTAGQAVEIRKLKAKREQEAKEAESFEVIQRLWEYWRAQVRPKARKLDAKTVEAVRARLADTLPDSEEPAYGPRYIAEAILGAKYEAWVNPATGKRYDALELICRDSAHLESFHDAYDRRKAARCTQNGAAPVAPPGPEG